MFKTKPPHIKFMCDHPHFSASTIQNPVPAFKKIPKWYRKLKPAAPQSVAAAGTAKRCIPFLDAVSQGYIIPLWADLLVRVGHGVQVFDENHELIDTVWWASDDFTALFGKPIEFLYENGVELPETIRGRIIAYAQRTTGEPSIQFTLSCDEVGTHSYEQVVDAPFLSKQFGKQIAKLVNPWAIETPEGWSVQFKNPSNSFETNLHLFEGVVDTDTYNSAVHLPFIWTGDELGEFLIPAGTPLVQIIPFKRETLELIVEDAPEGHSKDLYRKLSTKAFDRYKTLFWHKRREPE